MVDTNTVALEQRCEKYEVAGAGWHRLSGQPWLETDGTASFEMAGTSAVFIRPGCTLSLGAMARVKLHPGSKLFITGRFSLWYDNFIELGPKSTLILGYGYMNRRASIEVSRYIDIGDTIMGPDAYVIDTDCHHIFDADGTVLNPSEPVKFCGHVWLGQGATVLKGVTIGQGSCVGAHSVVCDDVPEKCLAAGSPAKVIKTGITWK